MIQILDTFGIGDSKVKAAMLFFSRGIDIEENIDSLVTALTPRDALEFFLDLGWYSDFRSNNPTGKLQIIKKWISKIFFVASETLYELQMIARGSVETYLLSRSSPEAAWTQWLASNPAWGMTPVDEDR